MTIHAGLTRFRQSAGPASAGVPRGMALEGEAPVEGPWVDRVHARPCGHHRRAGRGTLLPLQQRKATASEPGDTAPFQWRSCWRLIGAFTSWTCGASRKGQAHSASVRGDCWKGSSFQIRQLTCRGLFVLSL